MAKNYLNILKNKLDNKNLEKLEALNNSEIFKFVAEYIELCGPKSVFVRTDFSEDIAYIREKVVELEEEKKLTLSGHTFHFDGFFDQARDKGATKYLLPKNTYLGHYTNSIDREKGLKEIRAILKGIMKDKEMLVCFFCLGPLNSSFSIPAVQITDSFYVAHSEDILYRPGYEEFKKKNPAKFFRFVHSAGELEGAVSKNIDKRRIYIDLEESIVYSSNTQYAGNTVGLKKLALRLAINKASKEGWLAEHMFIMGVHNKEGKKAYFCGAYPSMCGKTSTAMIVGEAIVGDDIAYLRANNGKAYAANVERGIFGIIKGVNSKDDPILFKALNKEGEVIFSNILVDDKGIPFWVGKGAKLPRKGVNFSGDWFPGKTNEKGEEIPPSHKNARYTIGLSSLENVDRELGNPQGVEVSGIIYGGRDSDTSVPVEEALSWAQGICIKAASLESETTAATLGQEGVRAFNPMSNIDFVSIPLGTYIDMNLNFGKKLKKPALIFSVNYFLLDKDVKFFNDLEDKRVWLKWMRARIDGAVSALATPTGLIPLYEDLKDLFEEVLNKEYKKEDYITPFTLRIPENIAKIERIRNIYKDLKYIPAHFYEELDAQEVRLRESQKKFGDYVSPLGFSG
ncbi:MAG: phosphoenolpyruvate carboxykinase (GTP) [Candidatus Omnitrophota bacterium]|nr:MAG: phosphoenolpyruvate carboxykinase (GTP) [Candidatus Omnitrophota bacterium]